MSDGDAILADIIARRNGNTTPRGEDVDWLLARVAAAEERAERLERALVRLRGMTSILDPAYAIIVDALVSGQEHAHEWEHGPTYDTNPPSESRRCACGRVETRSGVGVAADGSRIEPTPWRVSGQEHDEKGIK